MRLSRTPRPRYSGADPIPEGLAYTGYASWDQPASSRGYQPEHAGWEQPPPHCWYFLMHTEIIRKHMELLL